MSITKKTADGGRRRGIQSVEIGLDVLQKLSALGSASPLSVIAQECGMAPPQVHRYLQSLIAAGMARQDAATGKYDLGPAAIQLGLSALARTDAFRLVDAGLSEFAMRVGQTVQVAALGAMGPTIVRWYSGTPGVVTSLSVGSVLPVLQSATGRVFLAFERGVLAQTLASKEQRRSPIAKADLSRLLDQVRADGRAQVSGTVIPGLSATAFPIFDLQGRPILTATLLTQVGSSDEDFASAVDELAAICRQISRDLGWKIVGDEPAGA